MTETTQFDIDSLLDGTLEDLADAPSFKPFPAGVHQVKLSLDLNTINDKTYVELNFTGIATLEPAEGVEEVIKEGDEASILYDLTTEFGQGGLKELRKVLNPVVGTEGQSNRAFIEAVKELECVAVTGIRSNKEKTRDFMTLANIIVG